MLKKISSLNNLRTFVLAAEHLSFKIAAKILNISPTAVSHQIKSLEEQLRMSLFVRHTRAISLTYEGEKLAAACKESFNNIDVLIEQITYNKNEVTFSCCNSFAALWLTPNSQELNKLLPSGNLKICASDSLIDLSRDKHIDLALRYGKNNHDVNEVFLCTEEIGLYRSKNIPLPTTSKPQLYVTQWPNNDLLPNINWRSMVNTNQYNVTQFEQEYFVLQAIITGQGYGLLSNILANSALKQGWIEPVTNFIPQTGYSYWLRVNKERETHLLIRQVSQWLSSKIKE